MPELKPPLYCSQCKKHLSQIEDLLFVDGQGHFGFCSEKCIETFYQFLIDHYLEVDKKLRDELGISKEKCLGLLGDPDIMDSAIMSPNEIYYYQNELGHGCYGLITKHEDSKLGPFWSMIFSFIYDGQVSFVFSATLSQSKEYIDAFRKGKKCNIDSLLTPPHMEEEVVADLERKKGRELALLLEQRSESDIPFENFHFYEDCIIPCLQEPDEHYSWNDNDGEPLYTSIKSFEKEGVTFYYYVLSVPFEEEMVPILSFPSTDGNIYKTYKRGDQIAGSL